MPDWYPAASVRRYRLDGGSMLGGPPRIILHTTETTGIPRYGDPAGSNSAPHFTVHSDGSVLQHQPINRASRALRNLSGGVQTNRQGAFCVQIEVVAYSKNLSPNAPNGGLPDRQRAALAQLVSWLRAQTNTPATYRNIYRGSHCYGTGSVCRMTPSQWTSFAGIAGHQEVPENTHWDPGGFTIAAILEEDNDMPFTEQEVKNLKEVSRAIDDLGSNGYGFVTEAVQLIRGLYELFRKLMTS